jgi:hypothetical protein
LRIDHYLVARSGARLLFGEPFARVESGADGQWIVNEKTRRGLSALADMSGRTIY